MKKTEPIADNDISREKCEPASCEACSHCSALNYEEARPEWKENSFQLYARELHQYLFYYNTPSGNTISI
jgi:hypothetical protein